MKMKYFIELCAFVALFAACDDNQQMLFEGKTSLQFALSDYELDSISCSFLNTSGNQFVVNLPVEVNGYAKRDFRFRLVVDAGKSTAVEGKHYDALAESYEVKRDEYEVKVPVTLNYSRDLDSVSVKLVLRIEPLEGLGAGIPYKQEVTIVSSNLLPPIPDWDRWYSYEFGTYSKVKHRYILSELRLNEKIRFENTKEWRTFSAEQREAYGLHMNNFFAEHEIYDEFGQRIEPWMN